MRGARSGTGRRCAAPRWPPLTPVGALPVGALLVVAVLVVAVLVGPVAAGPAVAGPPGPDVTGPDVIRPDPTGPDTTGPDTTGPGTGPDVAQPVGPVPRTGTGVPAPGARYAWPLWPAPAVATPFQAPPHPYGRGHRGVDLVAEVGAPVLAARAGTVVFAGPVAGRGVVSVQHDDGLRTTYEPVHALVTAGTAVAAGAVLGTVAAGHRGCPTGCLHWGVRRDRLDYLDPLVLLRPTRVRLLPVPDPWPTS